MNLQVTLLTGRSLGQGRAKELGKLSAEYEASLAVCDIDPDDMKVLDVSSGQNVTVETKYGSVVLRAQRSNQAPHRGVIFIPYGPWANLVTSDQTDGTGMPTLKGIDAKLLLAKNQQVLKFDQVIQQLLGQGK